MNTPILFLIFNRPDTTKIVFNAIRRIKPKFLYIAADGARGGRKDEISLCMETRKIVEDIDWDCQVKTLLRDENLGCKMAVSGAISWFFEQEEFGIILEDDCLPSESWFPFATEMLERYKDNEKIMCISASHFHGDLHQPSESYFFSIYNHCWGWASWRRAWQQYDVEVRDWPNVKNTKLLEEVGGGNRLFKLYWSSLFSKVYNGDIDTWDYQWTFCCWSNGGLTILPSKNLVKNIGFGEDATHTVSSNKHLEELPLESLEFPLSHPVNIQADRDADLWTSRNMLDITLSNYFKKVLLIFVRPFLNYFSIRK